jgi:hypothetical protein
MLKRTFMKTSLMSSLAYLYGCGPGDSDFGKINSPTISLTPPSINKENDKYSEFYEKIATDEASYIANFSHNPSWVYYTNISVTNTRWYISPIDIYSKKSGIYSLGPITANQASWWTVSPNSVSGNFITNQITISPIIDSSSDIFFDIGRQINISNSQIHSDRSLISNSTVSVKWYFFKASNGYWYIISDPRYSNGTLLVKRFSSLNGNYNWIDISTSGLTAVHEWSLGLLNIRLVPISAYVDANLGKSWNMDSTDGAQCVDLMHHYIDNALGVPYPHGFTGNAYSIYLAAANITTKTSAKYGSINFIKMNYTSGSIPNSGDIIFWSAPGVGHVANAVKLRKVG